MRNGADHLLTTANEVLATQAADTEMMSLNLLNPAGQQAAEHALENIILSIFKLFHVNMGIGIKLFLSFSFWC